MNVKVVWLDFALADALLELVIEVATRSRDQTDPSLKIETLNLQNLNTICENTDRPVAENENFKIKKLLFFVQLNIENYLWKYRQTHCWEFELKYICHWIENWKLFVKIQRDRSLKMETLNWKRFFIQLKIENYLWKYRQTRRWKWKLWIWKDFWCKRKLKLFEKRLTTLEGIFM